MRKGEIKRRVLYILENFPKTRDSDIEMYIQYFKEFICTTDLEKEVIENLLNRWTWLASLTRLRADIQNKDLLFTPTDITKIKRKIYEMKCNEVFKDDYYESEYWINYKNNNK